MEKIYMCIDLKSFYASVECKERGLNPLTTNLVVADKSRTEKTICLAVTPSLKSYGIPGRARLFEVIQKVKDINFERRIYAPNHKFSKKSYNDIELKKCPWLELDFIIAEPRMAYYMKYSSDIYNIYLKYLAPEDIYVYSVDEVFCDITNYLKSYKMTSKELTNLYLAKVAMDVGAKHVKPNSQGVRIAELDEMSYRKLLWSHRPITDFWRVGKGYSKRLEANNMYTMGDVARCSIEHEDLLYKLFGINAELLIDHAWGIEPCTLEDIRNYKPSTNSLSLGQVLHCPYDYNKTKLIVKEMTDLLVLDLVEKRLVTNQIVLTIGYDIDNLKESKKNQNYNGEVTVDRYGRKVPKHAHGTINLVESTSSTKIILEKTMELFERIIDKNLLTRRINVVANNVQSEDKVSNNNSFEQLNLFTEFNQNLNEKHQKEIEKERNLQHAIIDIKRKYGKNAILKGMNFEEGGTTISRNSQIGGHRAG